MAIVTTIMTGPAIDVIEWFSPGKKASDSDTERSPVFRILISFGNPENGTKMLRLAHNFVKKSPEKTAITLLHLSPAYDLHKYNTEEYEQESFRPLFGEADKLGINIKTMFKASQDIEHDIIQTANSGSFDLIIAGKAHSLYEGTILGNFIGIIMRILNPGRIYESLRGNESLFSRSVFDGPTRRLVKSIKIPTGIFIDNNFTIPSPVIVPVYSPDDLFIFPYATKLVVNNHSIIKILDFYNQIEFNDEMNSTFKKLKDQNPGNVELITSENISETMAYDYNLLLVSIDGWQKFIHDKRVEVMPSALIIRN
jgi:hypothetical protein